MTELQSMGGMEWTIEATLRTKDGKVQHGATVSLRWADSYVCEWHPSHLGETIQLALVEAKKRAFPRWKWKKRKTAARQ